MQTTIQHDSLGTISYDENIWTGKRKLRLNGKELIKINRKTYQYSDEEQSFNAELRGNTVLGVTLTAKGERIEILPPPAWYVWAFSLFMFLFILVWGNVPALVQIFPVVGGGIGGLVAGLFAILNVFFSRSAKNTAIRLLICVACTAATILICFLIALAVLSAM